MTSRDVFVVISLCFLLVALILAILGWAFHFKDKIAQYTLRYLAFAFFGAFWKAVEDANKKTVASFFFSWLWMTVCVFGVRHWWRKADALHKAKKI